MTYPVHLLREKDRALMLFCAAFGGKQDCAFVRDAGLKRVVCIDTDGLKMSIMKPDYPAEWEFYEMDAFAAVQAATDASEAHPDVLSLDPWSGDLEEKCIDIIGDLIRLTRRVLIFGVTEPLREKAMTEFAVHGYVPVVTRRTGFRGGAYWLSIEKFA